MLKTQKLVRRAFEVDAVLVTTDNLEEVAKWCSGDVREGIPNKGKTKKRYVKVRVLRPLNERQTMAFPGDWVLYAGTGFKVYTNEALFKVFEIVKEDDHDYGAHLEETKC